MNREQFLKELKKLHEMQPQEIESAVKQWQDVPELTVDDLNRVKVGPDEKPLFAKWSFSDYRDKAESLARSLRLRLTEKRDSEDEQRALAVLYAQLRVQSGVQDEVRDRDQEIAEKQQRGKKKQSTKDKKSSQKQSPVKTAVEAIAPEQPIWQAMCQRVREFYATDEQSRKSKLTLETGPGFAEELRQYGEKQGWSLPSEPQPEDVWSEDKAARLAAYERVPRDKLAEALVTGVRPEEADATQRIQGKVQQLWDEQPELLKVVLGRQDAEKWPQAFVGLAKSKLQEDEGLSFVLEVLEEVEACRGSLRGSVESVLQQREDLGPEEVGRGLKLYPEAPWPANRLVRWNDEQRRVFLEKAGEVGLRKMAEAVQEESGEEVSKFVAGWLQEKPEQARELARVAPDRAAVAQRLWRVSDPPVSAVAWAEWCQDENGRAAFVEHVRPLLTADEQEEGNLKRIVEVLETVSSPLTELADAGAEVVGRPGFLGDLWRRLRDWLSKAGREITPEMFQRWSVEQREDFLDHKPDAALSVLTAALPGNEEFAPWAVNWLWNHWGEGSLQPQTDRRSPDPLTAAVRKAYKVLGEGEAALNARLFVASRQPNAAQAAREDGSGGAPEEATFLWNALPDSRSRMEEKEIEKMEEKEIEKMDEKEIEKMKKITKTLGQMKQWGDRRDLLDRFTELRREARCELFRAWANQRDNSRWRVVDPWLMACFTEINLIEAANKYLPCLAQLLAEERKVLQSKEQSDRPYQSRVALLSFAVNECLKRLSAELDIPAYQQDPDRKKRRDAARYLLEKVKKTGVLGERWKETNPLLEFARHWEVLPLVLEAWWGEEAAEKLLEQIEAGVAKLSPEVKQVVLKLLWKGDV